MLHCSVGLRPEHAAVNGEADVLKVDTNRCLTRTSERIADNPLGSPLIIRPVTGHLPGSSVPDGKKSQLDRETGGSDDLVVDRIISKQSDANRRDGNLANFKGDDDVQKLRVGKNTPTKTASEAEVVDQINDAEVARSATGCDSAVVKHEGSVLASKHAGAEDISHGHTTNADRALRMAPFTHASHGISVMCSEVAGGVGGDDSDEEAGDGNLPPAGSPAQLRNSPLGSSSSAQLSGNRSVQHMLKQIHDAGERINERISARDFGARRRLPAVPVDTSNDSEMPTSSHSAKSDGSGEAHLEHRPVRSILEELPRPAIRNPKSVVRNCGSPSGTSRQLPDRTTLKHLAKTDNQLTPTKLENLSDGPLYDEVGLTCSTQLPDCCFTKSSKQDDLQPNPTLLRHDVDVPTQGKPPVKLSDSVDNDAANTARRQLPDPATEPSVPVDNPETTMHSVYNADILARSPEKNLKHSFSGADASAENKELPDLPSTKHSVLANRRVSAMQPVCDPDVLVCSVDLIAAESVPESLRCSANPSDIIAVTELIGRGMADGESPRNTISDEVGRKTSLDEHQKSLVMKLRDLDNCADIPHSQYAVLDADGNSVKCTSTQCLQTQSSTPEHKTLIKRALYNMQSHAVPMQPLPECNAKCKNETDPLLCVCSEYFSSSNAAINGLDFITADKFEHDLNAGVEHASVDLPVELQTCQSQTSVTHPDIVESLGSESQKGNNGPEATANSNLLAVISVPSTCCPAMRHIDTSSRAQPVDALANMLSKNSTATEQHDVLFVLHNDRQTNNEVIKGHAEERMHSNSSAATEIAKISDKLTSSDSRLNSEMGENRNLSQQCSQSSALPVPSPAAVNGLAGVSVETAKVSDANDNRDSHRVNNNEQFCLAGPKRALFNRNTPSVPSSSAVIKTGSLAPTAVNSIVNLAGNSPVKNNQSTSTHTPVIRSTIAAQTAAVLTTTDKFSAMCQRRPANVAMKIDRTGLSHMTGLPPPIRFSNHSPQPPTKPASKPAVVATQARFIATFAYYMQ